jgi:nucleoside-diphosphate-sugar epimerase
MSVSIIGCGWVGQALATKLISKNIDVIASYQSLETHEKLTALGIVSKQLILPINENEMTNYDSYLDAEYKSLFEVNTLVIAIPPQLKKGQTNYGDKIKQLVTLANKGQVKRIILLNSTAIYNGLHGEVDETCSLDYSAAKVAALTGAEQEVKQFSGQGFILRLSGLVGPERHPGKFLQRSREFVNAQSPVNLVHQTDVVNIIEQLYLSPYNDDECVTYNVVSSTESDRRTYYQTAAKALKFPAPVFNNSSDEVIGKKIIGNKLRQALQYQYAYDDLLAWIEQNVTTSEH